MKNNLPKYRKFNNKTIMQWFDGRRNEKKKRGEATFE